MKAFAKPATCPFCKKTYLQVDSRAPYCPDCMAHKASIDRVAAGRPVSTLTEAERQRIWADKTTARGPFFNPKAPR